MADNTQIPNALGGTGTGDFIRDKDRGTAKTQIVAIDLNPAGAETLMAGVMPISAASLPLPTGAAQDGTDITTPTAMPAGGVGIRGWLSAIWTKLNGTLGVTGTFWQATQPVSLRSGTKAFTTAAPTASAAQCLAANANRLRALIENNGVQTVYLGKDNTITTATGLPLASGASAEDDATTDAWYAITATGTGDLRIVEVS
jgi:hypothetical protein